MALTLAESAKFSTDQLLVGTIESFVQEAVVLDRLPLITVQGNAYTYNQEASLPGVAFRAVNSAYAESTGVVNPVSETLKILGGDIDVDRFLVQTRGNLHDLRAEQTAMKLKAMNYAFNESFINGDGASNNITGLKARLTGVQVISAATNGLPIVSTTDDARHAFMDKVDETLAAVQGGADVIYVNSAIRSKLRSAARRLGFWDKSTDAFGRVVELYNGIPIQDIGQDSSGTDIIGVAETQGSSNATSSLYAVKFSASEGSVGVAGINNGGMQVTDLGECSDKAVYRTRVELYVGLALFGGRSAARLKGILNA